MERREQFDREQLARARQVAQNSKDPSTKCGCVLVGTPYGGFISSGYNHLSKGISKDVWPDREMKYPRVVHAELTAVLGLGQKRTDFCAYIWPLFSCSQCALALIEAGVTRVVSQIPNLERWKSAYDLSAELYQAAGVEVVHYAD